MNQFQPDHCVILCFCVHVYGEPALPSEDVSLHNAADENECGSARQDGLGGGVEKNPNGSQMSRNHWQACLVLCSWQRKENLFFHPEKSCLVVLML